MSLILALFVSLFQLFFPHEYFQYTYKIYVLYPMCSQLIGTQGSVVFGLCRCRVFQPDLSLLLTDCANEKYGSFLEWRLYSALKTWLRFHGRHACKSVTCLIRGRKSERWLLATRSLHQGWLLALANRCASLIKILPKELDIHTHVASIFLIEGIWFHYSKRVSLPSKKDGCNHN